MAPVRSLARRLRPPGAMVEQVLGAGPVATVADRACRGLRVLAYHGLPDPAQFRRQLAVLASRYRPVALEAVEAAFHGGPALPARAVWVTFDDGDPEVLDHGRRLLGEAGVKATMFVCPAVVDGDRPYWWQVVEDALSAGVHPEVDGVVWRDRSLVARLKTMPDVDRRAVVVGLAHRLGDGGRRHQATLGSLRRWVADGHTVGNHTWDHPCLDRCDADAQREQVTSADRWLASAFPGTPRVFAYPNGDWAAATEQVLAELGYRIGVLFDHRIAAAGQAPLRLSRLRVSTDTEPRRFRAIVCGAHPLVFSMTAQASRRA